MEEDKDMLEKTVYTTYIFSNIQSLDEQHVRFFPDWWDHELEFLNLKEVKNYWAVLPSDLHGQSIIMNSAHKLLKFAQDNGYELEEHKDDGLS